MDVMTVKADLVRVQFPVAPSMPCDKRGNRWSAAAVAAKSIGVNGEAHLPIVRTPAVAINLSEAPRLVGLSVGNQGHCSAVCTEHGLLVILAAASMIAVAAVKSTKESTKGL